MKKSLYILIILFLFSHCLDKNTDLRDIKIINKSNNIIYCLTSFSDTIDKSYLGSEDNTFNRDYRIEKDSFNNVYDKPQDWDSFIEYYGTVRLFIIVKDTVDKYGWEKVLKANYYQKIYKLTINDLNKNHWQIEYNGQN